MSCVHCKDIECNGEHSPAKGNMGGVSDGYHTFDELYEHRVVLWMALCRIVVDMEDLGYVWRSQIHSDGSAFDGWFVLGMGYRQGTQMTYHVPMKYWDSCAFARTVSRAPRFDGHTSGDVLARLKTIFVDPVEKRTVK